MKKVLVIGSAVCDVVMEVDHLPSRSEDINFYRQKMSLGGCAFNVCDCLRHFGVPFIPFLPVGRGMYGSFVRERLAARGIVSACPPPDGENGCCYCLVEPDGERTFLCYRGAEYLFEEEWLSRLDESPDAEQIGCVYVCGLEMEEETGESIVRYLERHREYGVFFAPSARICQIAPERMERMLELRPVLHLNEEEALRFTHCEAIREAGEALSARTHNTVLVTRGRHGCLIFDPENGSCTQVDAFPAEDGGDAIGAGDSHIGSVIALLQKGYAMRDAVRGANRVAAAVAGVKGALLSDERFEKLSFRFTVCGGGTVNSDNDGEMGRTFF